MGDGKGKRNLGAELGEFRAPHGRGRTAQSPYLGWQAHDAT